MLYKSRKTYTHEEGLSVCFRQWRAGHSHCQLLHGYSLGVEFTFVSTKLDDRNWVVDFGGMKDLKQWLHVTFDHTCLIANDDPELETFRNLHRKGLIELKQLDHVGLERFAEYIAEQTFQWLDKHGYTHVALESVTVSEHAGNAATVDYRN